MEGERKKGSEEEAANSRRLKEAAAAGRAKQGRGDRKVASSALQAGVTAAHKPSTGLIKAKSELECSAADGRAVLMR
ncbi:Arginine-Glutamic Acid Dipeptide Repeats Protein [Manis pentadactyla]|nr:Arginine-Glutamic Acid Dipeptide Repeats Protein [Manis pentadactyla]